MKKIISKIAGTLLGLSLALGVGVSLSLSKRSERVNASSDLSPSPGVFILDFYDDSTMSSTSGSNLTNSNYAGFVKVATGLTVTNVVTSVSDLTGNVRYGMAGGLTLGKNDTSASSVTFNIGSDFAVNKITLYGAKYDNSVAFTVNGANADSGSLADKGTEIGSVTSPLIWDNLGGITAITLSKTGKRITAYAIVCEYSTSIDKKDVTLSLGDASNAMIAGHQQQLVPTATCEDQPVTTLNYSYSSNDTDVATVSNTGLVTAVDVGTATITVTSGATDDYKSGSVQLVLTVTDPNAVVKFVFPTDDDSGVGSYTDSWTATHDTYQLDIANFNNNNNGWTYIACGRKKPSSGSADSVATITTHAAISSRITSVSIGFAGVTTTYLNSAKLYVSNTSSFNSTDTKYYSVQFTPVANSVVKIDIPNDNSAINLFYKVEFDCSGEGSANGFIQVKSLKFTAEPIELLPELVIKNSSSDVSPFVVNFGNSGMMFYAYDVDTSTQRAVEFSVSDSSILNLQDNGDGSAWIRGYKAGTANLIASLEGYEDAVASITINVGSLQSVVVTGAMTKTSYYVGESWSPAGLVATATYEYGYSYDASEDVAWTYSPASPALNVVSVTATATLSAVSGNSAAQTVSVSKVNPIQQIYSMAVNDSVDIYGVFVGNKDANNIIVMDGAYGIDVYKSGCGTNSYVENETILHVVGKVATFHGLYEISTVTTLTEVSTADVETPVVYSCNGDETAEFASRTTTVTGVPSVVSGDLTATAGAADITLSFSVGGKPVQVFYKKGTQVRADMDTINAAVTGEEEMTVKGFTAYFDGFQVQMTGIVEAAEGYTAAEFSQDLLDQTDAVCTLVGEKTYEQMKSALTSIWSDLASADKYPSLPSGEKTALAEAARDESGTVVEQAMARYDQLTGKYELNNFINGRTPVAFAPSSVEYNANANTSASTIIIVVVALTSITSIGVLLVIKRKRSLVK